MPKYIYYIRQEKNKYQPYRCSKNKEEAILGAYPACEDAKNALHFYTMMLYDKKHQDILKEKTHFEGY